VGAGSSASKSENSPTKTGHDEQEHADDGQDGDDEDDDRVGHRRLDLAAQLDLGLVVLGDLQQDGVEEAADLPGPRHVDQQRREGLRLLGERRRQECPVSTSLRTSPSRRASSLFSVCSVRIVSARSSDSPESIIVANCREKTARSFSPTLA
jgi:hypothetical protein